MEDIIPFYNIFFEKYNINIVYNHYNYIHPFSCYGFKCESSNLSVYNPLLFDTDKILESVNYCKNAKWLPYLKNKFEIEKYYKEIPNKYIKTKRECIVLKEQLSSKRYVISSNGDYILSNRCWMDIGYFGNIIKDDFLPKESKKIKEIVENINKNGLPPPCQRLCCAGKVL